MSEITQKFEDGSYTQDELLDWHDSYGENMMYQNSLKNLSEDQYENTYTHQDEDFDYKIGEVNQVPVIYEKNIRPKIFGQNLDNLQEAGEKVQGQLQATPGFLKDTITSIPYGMAKGVDNAFKLVDELTGGAVSQLDNYFVENFPNTLGKKVEMEEPEGAGGMTGTIIGQYVVPGIGIYKLARNIMLIAEPLTVGLFSSKDEGNLMSLFEGYASKEDANVIAKTIIQSLTADEDDSEFMARLKNIGADAIPFVAVERIYKILKALKKNPEAIQEIKSAGAAATPTEPPTPVEVVDSSGQVIKQADELVPSEKPFYSNVEKTISNFTFKKQPGNQILATLNNTSGIKQSEIQDLGLDTFLKDNPSVTKEQLDDFIADKSLTTRVNDTILEGTARQQKNDIDFITRDPEDNFTYNVPTVLRNAQSYEDAKLIVKNDEITYAELLDYVAAKNPNSNVTSITDTTIENFLKDEFGIVKRTDNIKPPKFESYVTPGGENYKEMLITAPGTPQVFTDHHYRGEVAPGENLIAHARFNDRTIDGNKILFIEEIQSDLHQAGRKQGYRTQKNIDAIRGRLEQVNESIDFYTNKVKKSGKDLEGSELDEANSLLEERGRLKEFLNNDIKLVADAPFKKNWYELTMKRIIKYAVDNGYDGIAFTSGDMQVARYPGMSNPEGLKGFYNNTLTDFTNKFGKKYGAKIDEASIGKQDEGSISFVDGKFNYQNTRLREAETIEDVYQITKENKYLQEEFQLYLRDDLNEATYANMSFDDLQKELGSDIDSYINEWLINDFGLEIGVDSSNKVPIMLFTPKMEKEILTEGVSIAQVENQQEKNTALV